MSLTDFFKDEANSSPFGSAWYLSATKQAFKVNPEGTSSIPGLSMGATNVVASNDVDVAGPSAFKL